MHANEVDRAGALTGIIKENESVKQSKILEDYISIRIIRLIGLPAENEADNCTAVVKEGFKLISAGHDVSEKSNVL